jgi:hypothetical protein
MRPTPGNHEYFTANAAGYYDYFGAAAHGPDGYYSYEHGDWHIVVLNSACDQADLDCDAQLDWLETDLGASDAPCTLAYWHHPRYSTGFHGDADEDGEEHMVPFWNALATAGAEIVLSGHDHHYERFLPSSGLVQFVVGTGGATLRSTAISSAGTSAYRQHTVYGVLQLRLWSNGYESSFLPVGGGALDVQGLTPCH